MGRKNWLFSKAPAGARFYSLIETVKERDLASCLVWLLYNAPELSRADGACAEFIIHMNAPQGCRIPKFS